MNNKIKKAVYLSLLLPLSGFAVGLGDMTVHSYLNQPFKAEVELLDVGNTPISTIKAYLASLQDFERAGLERAYYLNLLNFKVEKVNGKPIISITSQERLSAPYIELLIDLAWSNGQIYRSYTILLDPPQYQLATTKPVNGKTWHQKSTTKAYRHERGVVEKPIVTHVEHDLKETTQIRDSSTYGPTKSNETIWQIAQRYNEPDLSLQQIILSIVGENPDAFENGNLNGLKADALLSIPTTEKMQQVPEQLAKREVVEHDKAWRLNERINHVLMPPYTEVPISAPEVEASLPLVSVIPSVSMSDANIPISQPSSIFSEVTSFFTISDDAAKVKPSSASITPQERLIAEINVAKVAIDSVRDKHAVLSEDVEQLKSENKALQEQLSRSEQAIEELKKELQRLKVREGLAAQVSSPQSSEPSSFSLWFWMLLLLLIVASGVLATWWYGLERLLSKIRAQTTFKKGPEEKEPLAEEPVVEEPVVEEPVVEEPVVEEPVAEEPVAEEPVAEEPVVEEPVVEEPVVEEPVVEEPVAEVPVAEVPVAEEPKTEELNQEKTTSSEKDENIIEFEPFTPEPDTKETPVDETDIEPSKDKNTIEFDTDFIKDAPLATEPSTTEKPTMDETQETKSEEKPIKSKKALDTLLDLAETYIGMEDYEAARQSLEEVQEFGSPSQQEKAATLLEKLKKEQ